MSGRYTARSGTPRRRPRNSMDIERHISESAFLVNESGKQCRAESGSLCEPVGVGYDARALGGLHESGLSTRRYRTRRPKQVFPRKAPRSDLIGPRHDLRQYRCGIHLISVPDQPSMPLCRGRFRSCPSLQAERNCDMAAGGQNAGAPDRLCPGRF